MADSDINSAFYAARPILSIDGQDNAELTGNLMTLLVEETNAGLYRCELNFQKLCI